VVSLKALVEELNHSKLFTLFYFRFNELVNTGDGIAILETGLAFGGGCLQHYGINSNTSANGFIKCTFKKKVGSSLRITFASPGCFII